MAFSDPNPPDIYWLYYENPEGERFALHDGKNRCVLNWSISGTQYNWQTQTTAMGIGSKVGGYTVQPKTLEIVEWMNGCRPCDKLSAIGNIYDIVAPAKQNGCTIFEGRLWLEIKGERFYYKAVPVSLPSYTWRDDVDPDFLEDTLGFLVSDHSLYSDNDPDKLICVPLETENPVAAYIEELAIIMKFDGCEWSDMNSESFAIPVDYWNVVYEARDGKVYAGGDWAGNPFDADQGLYCYDPDTKAWTQVCHTVQDSKINDIIETPDGKIWIVGSFDAVDGGATIVNSVAVYDPATGTCSALTNGGFLLYDTLGNPISGIGNTIEVWNQLLLFGGNFLNAGGVCQHNYAIYDWVAEVWIPSDQYFNGEINDITQTPTGTFFGGDFTQISNVYLPGTPCAGGDYTAAPTFNNVAFNNGPFYPTLKNMNGGVGDATSEVYNITECANGVVISGDIPNFATLYNSGGYTPFAGINKPITMATCAADGTLYVSDGETTPITPGSGIQNFNIYCYQGGVFYPLKIQVYGTNPQLGDIHVGQASGCLYFTTYPLISVRSSACNKVVVPCDECVSPCFTFTGPGRLISVGNGSDTISFSDLGYKSISNGITLYPNETVKLDLTGELHPDGSGGLTTAGTLVSNIRGDITSFIMPGSNTAGFTLSPGENNIIIHIEDIVSDGIINQTAKMCYQCRYKAFPQSEEPLPLCD